MIVMVAVWVGLSQAGVISACAEFCSERLSGAAPSGCACGCAASGEEKDCCCPQFTQDPGQTANLAQVATTQVPCEVFHLWEPFRHDGEGALAPLVFRAQNTRAPPDSVFLDFSRGRAPPVG